MVEMVESVLHVELHVLYITYYLIIATAKFLLCVL